MRYPAINGSGNEAFYIDPVSGLVTVSSNKDNILDRERTEKLELIVEARDEKGKGLKSEAPLTIHLLDVNDNAPVFDKNSYEFTLSSDTNNFTVPAVVKVNTNFGDPFCLDIFAKIPLKIRVWFCQKYLPHFNLSFQK